MPMHAWSEEMVEEWLQEAGLGDCAPAFRAASVGGVKLLAIGPESIGDILKSTDEVGSWRASWCMRTHSPSALGRPRALAYACTFLIWHLPYMALAYACFLIRHSRTRAS